MFYDHDEMQMIFADYVQNDGLRWMNFTWDMVAPRYHSTVKPAKIWRGQRDLGETLHHDLSNGSTSQRTAKEFAWDYYLNRGRSQHGRKVALYQLVSHAGLICMSSLFGAGRATNEAELIIRNAVWTRKATWMLEDV